MATAAPSYSASWTIFAEVAEVYYDLYTQAVGAGGFAALQDNAMQEASKGQYSSEAIQQLNSHRQSLSQIISGAREALSPCLRELGRSISSTRSDDLGIIDDLIRYMDDNSDTINSRNFTRGSFSQTVGSSTGKGTLLRLSKDRLNYDLEGGESTTVVAECISDQNSGSEEGSAAFSVYTKGTVPADELFQRTATSERLVIKAKSGDDSVAGLTNPHFSSHSGSGTDQFSGWTASVAANVAQDTTNVFRADRNGTSSALKMQTGNVVVNQEIGQNVRLDRNKPWALLVRWNRDVGSGSGTLTIRMGATNASVAVSAQTGWQVLELVTNDPDGCWPDNATEDDLDISIEWTHTSGYLLVDDVFFGPLDGPINGTWIHIPNGATEWVLGDELEATDTASDTSILQEVFVRNFGRSLPSATGGSETISDP